VDTFLGSIEGHSSTLNSVNKEKPKVNTDQSSHEINNNGNSS